MTVRVFSARVKAGVIVPDDGVSLLEGSRVTVIAEAPAEGFELSPDDEDELLEAIAAADRGEVISAGELLQRLRR